MPEPQTESAARTDWIKALAHLPVRMWMCPIEEHAERRGVVTVEWIDGVAHCTAPGCSLTSANVRVARCTNVIEHPDLTATPCPGGLYFKPGDVQARCYECGAWCGSQVADYISSPPETAQPIDCGSDAADWCLADNDIECTRHDQNGDRRG